MEPSSKVGRIKQKNERRHEKIPVIMLIEFSHPKEPERIDKNYDIGQEIFSPYFMKKQKEGVKWKVEDYTDGTNTILSFMIFETMEDFTEIWGDEEFQTMFSRWSLYVDNCNVRILRRTQDWIHRDSKY